jgi:hypothetical protein
MHAYQPPQKEMWQRSRSYRLFLFSLAGVVALCALRGDRLGRVWAALSFLAHLVSAPFLVSSIERLCRMVGPFEGLRCVVCFELCWSALLLCFGSAAFFSQISIDDVG